MPVRITLPGLLQEHAGGQSAVTVDGSPATVGDAMASLAEPWPTLYSRIMTESREVRTHINVFVGATAIRHTGGLETPVDDGAEIFVLPAMSGG